MKDRHYELKKKNVDFYVVGAGIVSRMCQNPKHDADGGPQTKFRDFHLVGLRVVLRVTSYLQKRDRRFKDSTFLAPAA